MFVYTEWLVSVLLRMVCERWDRFYNRRGEATKWHDLAVIYPYRSIFKSSRQSAINEGLFICLDIFIRAALWYRPRCVS